MLARHDASLFDLDSINLPHAGGLVYEKRLNYMIISGQMNRHLADLISFKYALQ